MQRIRRGNRYLIYIYIKENDPNEKVDYFNSTLKGKH